VLQTFIGSLKGPSLKNELNFASEMQAAGDVLQLVENVSEEEGNKRGSRDGDGDRGGGCSGTSKLRFHVFFKQAFKHIAARPRM
jgi:hypothetical protein